jgi:hypothetical protein
MIPTVRRRRTHVLRRTTHATVVLVRGDIEVASWPLQSGGRPDLAVVNELARLQLVAQRLGWSVMLIDTAVELSELLDLVGLGEVVAVRLRVEVGREAEGGKEVGVKEVMEPGDPVT